MSKKERNKPKIPRDAQILSPLRIWWDRAEVFGRSCVRRIEFCCPAMAENWNRITQFKYHPVSTDMEVVNRAEFSAVTLQAAAVGHAAAVAVDEATEMCDTAFDCEDSVDYSCVFPWNYCPHCGAKIVVQQIKKEGGESA